MNPCESLWNRVMRDALMTGEQNRVREVIQRCYYDVCRELSWATLRTNALFTPGTDGTVVLPPTAYFVDLVWHEELKTAFLPRNLARFRTTRDFNLIWAYAPCTMTALYRGTQLSVSPGTTATLTGLTGTDVVGEYVQFAEEPYFYKILTVDGATVTFSPAYEGATIDGAEDDIWTIRPIGTPVIQLYDRATGTDVACTDQVRIHYAQLPPPLYLPSNMVLVEEEPIYLLSMKDCVGDNQRDLQRAGVYASRYRAAIAEAKMRNPDFWDPNEVIGAAGEHPLMGGSTYQNYYLMRNQRESNGGAAILRNITS